MKTLTAFLALALLPFQETKLEGRYRIAFDEKYQSQTYQITFHPDGTYTKRWPDAVTSKGAVKYEKFTAVLRKDMDEDPVEIDLREVGKDTIRFSTRSKKDQSKVMNRGMLIRIK